MIEAVFFDAMGTLMHLPMSVGHHYQIVTKRHGLDLGEKALDAAFRSAWKQMAARPAMKTPRPDDDRGWWRELVGRVLKIASGRKMEAGFDFEACFEEIYHHFTEPGVWELYPETAAVLASLAGKYRLGMISNFDGRLRVILDQLGILGRFETIIISSEAGADKPDAHIFRHALDAMKVRAADTLHVGDDPVRDWEAAAAIGMHVYKLERPRNSLGGVTGYLEYLNSPGRT